MNSKMTKSTIELPLMPAVPSAPVAENRMLPAGMGSLKVLVACEESQEVTKAFRLLGHETYSCDLQDCSGGHPEWHIKGNVIHQLYNDWDLIVAHPPCDRLANSGVRWLEERQLWDEMYAGCEFFNIFQSLGKQGMKVAIENPIQHKHAREYIEKYHQIIQPWQYGHEEMKATCIWTYNLPALKPTNIVGPPPKDKKEREKWQKVHRCPPGEDRSRIRSKTYPGIAAAMAMQWGGNACR